jgi:hypothetical protein
MNEYYYTHYEIKTFESGNYRGYDWEIKSNGSYPSRYIITPEEECIIHHYDGRNDFIICIGDESGHVWTRDEIYAEIVQTINELADEYEERKAEEERRLAIQKDLDRRARFCPSLMNEKKIYRLVGEDETEYWDCCYECGRTFEAPKKYSPWFSNEELAKQWVFKRQYDREYIEESVVYSNMTYEEYINQ